MQTYPESAGFDIGHWLSALALPQYTQAFIDNDIDQEILAGLTDADLKELGVASLGHRKRILAALAPAAPTSPAAPTAPDAPTVPATPLPQSATPVAPLLQSSEQTPATEPASAAQAAQVTPSTQTVSAAGADPAPADAPAAAAAGPAQSLKLFLSYGRDTYIPEVQVRPGPARRGTRLGAPH